MDYCQPVNVLYYLCTLVQFHSLDKFACPISYKQHLKANKYDFFTKCNRTCFLVRLTVKQHKPFNNKCRRIYVSQCPCQSICAKYLFHRKRTNVTFKNISAISWRSVLLVEQTGGHHLPVAN